MDNPRVTGAGDDGGSGDGSERVVLSPIARIIAGRGDVIGLFRRGVHRGFGKGCIKSVVEEMEHPEGGPGRTGVVCCGDSHPGGVMAVLELVIENHGPRQVQF
jgi:hypothetical protein